MNIDSNIPDSWDCQNSNYLYSPAGHVITGNLNVIPDSRVCYIISKGPKYRFPSNIDFPKCRREIAASLNDFSQIYPSELYALTFLLDNIFIRFGTKLYRQVVGIPMGTNCAPLVADLFLFCYERDFMMSLSDDKQADVIDAFNITSRYLDDILNINNVYFDNMVSQIYPSELQLNKTNTSDTEAAFLDLHLSISNDIVSTKIYDKRDDFYFEIVNFPFLDDDVPCSTSYGVYISQIIRFARASS